MQHLFVSDHSEQETAELSKRASRVDARGAQMHRGAKTSLEM